MAHAPRRWIRLDVGWSDSDWVGALEPAGRLAWVELLAYTKRDGTAGIVKALTPAAFARKARIPIDDALAMLNAAKDDGALTEDDGAWIITNWPEIDPPLPLDAHWSKVRLFVLDRDGWTCAYCGQSATHCDHIVPRSRGGDDDPKNLTAACAACNCAKGAQTPTEWRHGANSND